MTNQIIHGDCLEVIGDLPKSRMAWADPPDNTRVKYDGFKDKWPSEQAYSNWLFMVTLSGILAADVFWLSVFHTYQSQVWHMVSRIRERYPDTLGGISCRMIPWVYTFGQHRTQDCGSGYRPIFRFHRGEVTWNTDAIRVESQRQRNGDKRGDPRGCVPLDVWQFPRVCGTFKERRKWHKNQHPEALVERMVRMSCKPGDTVIDMFAGSGTTNRIGPKCEVSVRGIELSATYCRKISEETGADLVEHPSAGAA